VVALTEQRFTVDALSQLAETLHSLDIGPAATSISADRDRLVGTIRSYLIPRARDPELPMTVVVAGPTGSGKSTVVNSLSGTDVSPTGALRPTTKKPMVVASSRHVADHQVVAGIRCDTYSLDAPITDNMILVDTPDIDSTSTRHRALAEVIIDNADVIVFVTSALRYADDVPWQILRRARSRGAPVIPVLNRVQSASAGSLIDFRSRLSTAGMEEDLVVISEHHLPEGPRRVPSLAVQALQERLAEVMANREVFATEVFRRVLSATLGQIIELTESLAGIRDEIEAFENDMAHRLRKRVEALELGGIAGGLFPALPERKSRRAIRRWKRRAAKLAAEPTSAEARLIERAVTAVVADLRSWLVEERQTLDGLRIEPTPVFDAVSAAARSAAEGWVDYVARIALDFDENHAWLGARILINSAIAEETGPAVVAMFGERGAILVDRARRELVGRLEVVYQHVATLLADILRDRYGQPDETELRASLAGMTAALAPIDA
jgi:energy-coupling factor transporter ATP-binding protein EcfA2